MIFSGHRRRMKVISSDHRWTKQILTRVVQIQILALATTEATRMWMLILALGMVKTVTASLASETSKGMRKTVGFLSRWHMVNKLMRNTRE